MIDSCLIVSGSIFQFFKALLIKQFGPENGILSL